MTATRSKKSGIRGASATTGPAACTIIFRNFLSHAKVLARSFHRHVPGGRFYLLVVDGLPPGVELDPRIRLVTAQELGLSYFYELCFKYDVTELSTAVKPSLLRRLFRHYGEERVVYFDPDILLLRPLDELWNALDASDIVLTPHILSPIPDDGERPNERDILIAGAYNLGFIGLRRTTQTRRLLRWWEERLRDGCLMNPALGLMTDQKWIDLVPSLFPSTLILRDPTYNVAYWNLHERPLGRRGREYVVQERPVAFFHFSGFNPATPEIFSKHQTRTAAPRGSPLRQLLDHYVILHRRSGFAACHQWETGFSRFNNGADVHPLLRECYLALTHRARKRFGDPFDAKRRGSFLGWAIRPQRTGNRLSPFLQSLWRVRYDVASAFPHLNGKDMPRFLEWARTQGAREMGYDPAWVVDPLAGKQNKDVNSTPVSRKARHSRHPGVNVCGYLRSESGLGTAVRGYIRALRSKSIPLSYHDLSSLTVNRSQDSSMRFPPSSELYEVNLVCVNADEHFTAVRHLGEDFLKGRYNIAIWAWELPSFPEKWHDRFAHYDEIWVGSSFIANALAPVSPIPVVRIPPLLATGQAGRRARGRQMLGAGRDEFLFVYIFDFHSLFERKNPLAAVEAFRRAFKRSDKARLVIKCVNEASSPAEFRRLKKATRGRPIDVHAGYWSGREMRDLIAATDAYVSPHRAEGTGLTISEAMGAGKPVIATGWSGNMDFMNVGNSYPVEYRLVTLKRKIGPYAAGEQWAEPSVEHMAECMQQVYDHPGQAARRGEAARRDIATHFSDSAVGKIIRKRLAAVNGTIDRRTGAAKHTKPLASHRARYREISDRIREVTDGSLPKRATIVVVSKGDENLLQLNGREGWHFPQTADGVYAGYYPADSAAAVEHLEALRSRGGQYFLLPATSFWWLDYYAGLREHLNRHYRCAVRQDEVCVIYDLGRSPVKRNGA